MKFPKTSPPAVLGRGIAKHNSMDLDRTELLAPDPISSNENGRVWVESVSAGMRTVEAVIRELSQNDVPMLVVAERGSGKAAAAARIHELSSRVAEPFRAYQGREVSVQMLAAREGQGGTVYLQEVGDLTAALQKELVRQIGLQGSGDSQRRVPRFICGTSRELEPEVKAGKFREDLYYGISGVCLRLPPLRQRKEDIPLLRDWFLSAAARDFCRDVPALSPETKNFFLEYNWPGTRSQHTALPHPTYPHISIRTCRCVVAPSRGQGNHRTYASPARESATVAVKHRLRRRPRKNIRALPATPRAASSACAAVAPRSAAPAAASASTAITTTSTPTPPS